MTDTTDLIARLEAAEGPSFKLECDVALALGWKTKDGYWCSPDCTMTTPPRFTASLNAILPYVPEGRAWGVGEGPETTRWAQAWVRDNNIVYGANGATPAIAMCIAVIMARESDD